MLNNYFCETNYKLSDSTIDDLKSLVDTYSVGKGKHGAISQYQYTVFDVDHRLFTEDSFFSWVKITYNMTTAVVKFDANSYYRWHTDNNYSSRKTVLNIELDAYKDSFTLIKEFTGFKDAISESGLVHRVPYRFGYPMIINTTQPHCIINLENKPRYILTLGLHKEFSEVYDDFLKNGYI